MPNSSLPEYFEYIVTIMISHLFNLLIVGRFQKIFEHAYMIIRSQGALLIRLFMMMLSAGITQLTNDRDVEYLKEALALYLTVENAKKKFVDIFKESETKSYKFTVNWNIGSISRFKKNIE